MKKLSIIALVFVLTATALTACRRPSTHETTSPVETNHAMTTPTVETTTPTTHATHPSTAMTDPMDDMPLPGIIDGTDGTDGTHSTDSTANADGARRRRLPRY